MPKHPVVVQPACVDHELDEGISTLRRQLQRYCKLLSGSSADAEDLVQSTLLKALPVLQGAKDHPNLSALVRRIAKNTWIDHVRQNGKHQAVLPEELATQLSARPQEEYPSLEEAFQVLLQTLTPQQRAVVLLCNVFQYTDGEAAELLGISRGAVKAALHRARGRLASRRGDTDLTNITEESQLGILHAYIAAFRATDISMLIHLCQVGVLDPIHAACNVRTFGQRRAASSTLNRHTNLFVLQAA